MAARPGESEKAMRYIKLLDSARCHGQWDQICELTRKIAKHSPQRKCLVLTAQTESQVAAYMPRERPTTTATDTSGVSASSALAKLIPPLLAAIDEETAFLEDAYQAQICLGWIHWVLKEPQLAAARLPKDIMGDFARVTTGHCLSKAWTQVCAVKAVYIKGFSQEKTATSLVGLVTYRTASRLFASLELTLGSYSPEFRIWAERLLSRTVAVAMKSKPVGEWMNMDAMLQTFHFWISLFKFTPTSSNLAVPYEPARSAPSMVELGAEVEYSRWDVWIAYYDTLSDILQRGWIYAPSYTDKKPQLLESSEGLSESERTNSKLKQRTELKQVEASIEAKLMDETRFPKATERNSRVERWVDSIMRSWRVMCGPTWTDEELGQGGKDAVARGVLDSLYRAATKTFHSTQILRYLFNVHAYVTEFDLAMKAFNSFVELVQRGKAREDKTGERDYSLDNDDIILRTLSEAIRILCRYGDRKEVEKAGVICITLQSWIDRATTDAEAHENSDFDTRMPLRVPVSTETVAEAYRAMGICEATWARLTYDASARNTTQQKAAEYLRKSLQISFTQGSDLDTSYHLALVLAEMRELSAAIKVIKQALTTTARADLSASHANGSIHSAQQVEVMDWHRERKLIPFWHLLTLLLTAKGDLATAAKTSSAALELFEDFANLSRSDAHNEHTQGLEKSSTRPNQAFEDQMDGYEKEGIVQIKLTQIAIKEVALSPAEAVDSSAELLSLYSRLFGEIRSDLKRDGERIDRRQSKNSVSTLRNSVIRRMSRSKSRLRHDPEKPQPRISLPGTIQETEQPRTISNGTVAPSIQVTDEDGATPKSKRLSLNSNSQHLSMLREKVHIGSMRAPSRSPSRKLKKRSASTHRGSVSSSRPVSSHTMPAEPHAQTQDVAVVGSEPLATGGISNSNSNGARSETRSPNFSLPRPSTRLSDNTVQDNAEQPLRQIPHHLDRVSEPPPVGRVEQPPRQDVRLPAPHPASGDSSFRPIFSSAQERRHRLSLLIDLWLFIAGLYMRASIFDDAKAAIDEATELLHGMEVEAASESSSARGFSNTGWGGGKSIDELWGDVWAAGGDLSVAQNRPYESISSYEKALSYFPDHPSAIVGLSDLLLDIASQKIPPEAQEPPMFQEFSAASSVVDSGAGQTSAAQTGLVPTAPGLKRQMTSTSVASAKTTATETAQIPGRAEAVASPTTDTSAASATSGSIALLKQAREASPEELNRLAARDRAYTLLTTLTKLGTGWDYSEAWFALARSYELSGQVEKAKEVLWWVVELEDTRPLRRWHVVGACF